MCEFVGEGGVGDGCTCVGVGDGCTYVCVGVGGWVCACVWV